MRRRWLVRLVLGAVLLTSAACGGSDSSSGSSGTAAASRPALTVSAAASLKQAFTAYAERFPAASARFSFAGSDQLAAQIEQGARPDVYAAASTRLPERLYAKGLVRKPTVFGGNRLVLAVAAGKAKVGSLADIERPGVTLAIGSWSVPVGAYTRTVLAKLPAAKRKAILTNVRSEEPDVAGVVGKLTQGAADAGFVYVSDVRGTRGKLKAIELPTRLQPAVAYGAAVVKGAKHPKQAKAFIDGLVSGAGARALEDAGFEPPPSG
jgi:molybdate transport system substrate-binding protein